MRFLSEKPVKGVRKRHICQACDKFIEIGEAATNWCGINDGQFDSIYYHPDCREAEVAFNRLHEWGWMDDWMALSDREPEDNPWIKAEWPVPYLRLCMTREQYAKHLANAPVSV
jgi:hypothetical protein